MGLENPNHQAGVRGEYDEGKEEEVLRCPGCGIIKLIDAIYCWGCYFENRLQNNMGEMAKELSICAKCGKTYHEDDDHVSQCDPEG